jgi:hypothetical protein
LVFPIYNEFTIKGIYGCPRWTTKDGFEMQFQVNYLSHFLLTKRLLANLSKNGRIINLTSKLYESKLFSILKSILKEFLNDLNVEKRERLNGKISIQNSRMILLRAIVNLNFATSYLAKLLSIAWIKADKFKCSR